MLALENEFERGLYLHDEGYNTDGSFYIPQQLNTFTHIFTVPSVAEASFDSMRYQRSTIPASPIYPRKKVSGAPTSLSSPQTSKL